MATERTRKPDALRAFASRGERSRGALPQRSGADHLLALARILGGESSAHDAAEAWRPFRAYAAMHLWTEAAS